jgi:hypothetical protein
MRNHPINRGQASPDGIRNSKSSFRISAAFSRSFGIGPLAMRTSTCRQKRGSLALQIFGHDPVERLRMFPLGPMSGVLD